MAVKAEEIGKAERYSGLKERFIGGAFWDL
jgi:hypothetical protein